MKRKFMVVAAFAFFMTGGCQDKPAANTPEAPKAAMPQAHEKVATASSGMTSGTVLATMDGGMYTYVEIETEGKKLWAVGPKTPVAVGDKVEFRGGMPMPNYYSKTLDRTFDSILFVSELRVAGGEGAAQGATAGPPMIPQHGGHAGDGGHGGGGIPAGKAAVEGPKAGSIAKAVGGYTVAELFSQREQLSGKTIAVRGKVVKVASEIMGKNWVHLQDGTGAQGTNDLTVITDQTATEGDTVLVKGTLTKDKNFGAGYFYQVVIEDAKITTE
ncbi:MAG: hypothetical protein HYY20_12505 [Candidatus Tectomicrobia bacterium]|uniref:DNA-binding protein n=1 Tax=Tectimicrobiota bacterium TaxID=2528274 RepID=A0A932FXU9_UNCTE|nr:hypothetical protein [Candidatus Tectomicrobia bacterium]